MPRHPQNLMPWLSYWLSYIPGKSTLVLLFKAARRRVTEQTDGIAELPNSRIVSATEELNQIADDIRDAKPAPGASPSTAPEPKIRADVRRE
jgi:hypothetical protein